MEIIREIKNRDHGLPPDTSVSQKSFSCNRCHALLYVEFPSKVSLEEVTAFLNIRYPEGKGPCDHPVHETVEIFEREIRPGSFDRSDPALYQRTSPKGRPPNQAR